MGGKGRLRRIAIAPIYANKANGMVVFGGLSVPCALGRSGIARRKREGDGATPAGSLAFVGVYYRPDRIPRPTTDLPVFPLKPYSAWCDDPSDRRYNRPVRLPFPAGHERLWRADHLYDLVVVLDYNLASPRPGAGSAIFFHIAAPDFSPTLGCIAVALPTMQRILSRSGPGTFFEIS